MKRIWSFIQGLVYLGLLAVLVLAIVVAFRGIRGSGPAPAATSPADTPSPPPAEETLESTPTYLPIPTVFNPTPWPPDFTPSPTIVPTGTPEDVPYVITDTVNLLSLTVLPGWYARTPSANAVAGVTWIANYDIYHVDERPPGGTTIQISAGSLDLGQSFDQWLTEWRAYETSPEAGGFGLTLSEPVPYTLGQYQGVSFIGTGPMGETTFEIDLSIGERVVVIGISPADSPALPVALAILSTLEVLPEPPP